MANASSSSSRNSCCPSSDTSTRTRRSQGMQLTVAVAAATATATTVRTRTRTSVRTVFALLLIAAHATATTATATITTGASTSTASCSLCPGGTTSNAPWLTVSYKDYEMTCGAAEEYALQLDANSDACTDLVVQLSLSCRCFPEEITCPMCGEDESPLLSSNDCHDIYRELPLTPLGSVECANAQIIAQASGCCMTVLKDSTLAPPPLVQDKCTLCADGSDPLRDVTEPIYGDTTCNDLQAQTSVISNSSQVCYFIQTLGISWCQCPSKDFRQCKLCAGEDEMFEIPPFPDAVADLDGKTSCADLHESVSEFDVSCPTIQAKGHFLCGCPELPVLEEGSCSLCHDPNESYVNNIFETRLLDDGSEVNVFCDDAAVEIFASGNDTKKCAQAQAQAAISCGCQSHPAPPADPSCTLCPGGMDPEFPDSILDELGISCHTFNKLVPSLYDGSSCSTDQLSSYQNYCGCPEQAFCRLCNLGDEIVDPNKVVVNPTQTVTCADVDSASHLIQLGASIGAFQSQCQTFRDKYASECCPGSSIEPLDFSFPSPAPSMVPNVLTESNTNNNSGAAAVVGSLTQTLSLLLLQLLIVL